MFQPRIPIEFKNAALSATFTFPLAEYAFELEQELYVPSGAQSGAHGEFDMLRDGVAVKAPIDLRLSYAVYEATPGAVETKVDEMLAELWSFGRGWLYTSGLNASEAVELRRTRARARSMPAMRWEGGDIFRKRANVGFRCDPFWYGVTALPDSPFTINSDPDTLSITNSGNAPIFNAILTLAGTYTNPVIRNTTNGYQVASATDGSHANHKLRFDAGRSAVEKSTDGTTFTNDYTNYVRQTGQVHLMKLEVGQNDFTVTGCSSGTLAIDAYPAYH
jgi:hypothetical protein